MGAALVPGWPRLAFLSRAWYLVVDAGSDPGVLVSVVPCGEISHLSHSQGCGDSEGERLLHYSHSFLWMCFSHPPQRWSGVRGFSTLRWDYGALRKAQRRVGERREGRALWRRNVSSGASDFSSEVLAAMRRFASLSRSWWWRQPTCFCVPVPLWGTALAPPPGGTAKWQRDSHQVPGPPPRRDLRGLFGKVLGSLSSSVGERRQLGQQGRALVF